MSKFQLLDNLQEAKLIRNKSYIKNYSLQEILDATFIHLLTLDILHTSDNHKKFVQQYAAKTVRMGTGFDHYSTAGTDLHSFLHLIIHDENKDKLKNHDKDAKLIRDLMPNKSAIVHFVNTLKHDRDVPRGQINRFFLALESNLLVTDSGIRSLRRLARDWDNEKSEDVKLRVINKLLIIYRGSMRYSELYKELQKFAKEFKDVSVKEAYQYSDIKSRMSEAGGMDQRVVDAYVRLGDRQRGRPEMAMLQVQKLSAGGVVPYAVEHIGDLSHRMTHALKYNSDGYDTTKPKVDRCLKMMTNPYGFRKEHEENIISNSRYREMDPEQMSKEIDDALNVYSLEHNKLTAYNEAQEHAIMAAVTFGMKEWGKTVHHLRALQDMLSSEEKWNAEATKSVVDKHGDPIPYAHWPVTESKEVSISYSDLGFDTFDVDREHMPQIRKDQDDEFLKYLGEEGIAYDNVDVPVAELKPTQTEYNPDRLSKPKSNDRPIIISQDNYILDGHHRWTSSYIADQTNYINVIRIYMNINKLFGVVRDFDGAVFKGLHEASQVTETLDSPHPYKWTQWYDKNKTARFQTSHGNHINVIFTDTGAQSWDIVFYDEETLSDGATGLGDEFKIFSTVAAIIRDWWADQLDGHVIDRPYEISFSASKDESAKGRTALYARFAKQFAKETRMAASVSDSDEGTVFILKRRKKPKRVPNVFEDGRIVKGVNTTIDVGVDAVSKESAKLGFNVTKDGYPPLINERDRK